VGDIISEVGFRPISSRLPGPGPQPQEENISLGFSVETRLKPKFFEPFYHFWLKNSDQKTKFEQKLSKKIDLAISQNWFFYPNFLTNNPRKP